VRQSGSVAIHRGGVMAFEHACFISYAHGEHELMQLFIRELTQELQNSLDPYFDETVCIDRDHLRPGMNFDIALASAICRSVCMVVVYSPKYSRHPYCLREYEAMRRVEQDRRNKLQDAISPGVGMIIPIIFRGKKELLPAEIRDHVHYMDFRSFTLYDARIRSNRDYVDGIEKVAEYIFDLNEACEAAGADLINHCQGFELPGEAQIVQWRRSTAAFPGRGDQA